MKRANIKDNNSNYKGFILIEDMSDLINFRHEVTYGLLKESATELVHREEQRQRNGETDSHITDVITYGVEKLMEIKGGGGCVFAQAQLMGNYQFNQDMYLSEGKKLAINPYNNVSYFTLSDDAEIEIISENEIYTLEDIRVSKWFQGNHWYAKVGLIDVVVDGEMKWNTMEAAQRNAEEFLKSL